MDRILLFIPMYNCEKQIERVLKKLTRDVLMNIEEVIIVNNRSTDNGEQVVRDIISSQKDSKFRLLRNIENYGLGGSHKVAFNYALSKGFDYIIVLHGDDQGEVNNIIDLLESKEYRNYESCLGARFKKGSKLVGYSKFRTFGNRIYNMIFSIVLKKAIYDLGSGLNMYKVSSLSNKYYSKFPDNLTFNYVMIMATNFYNQRIMFFPIIWKEEDQVSNVKMMSQAVHVLKMLMFYAVNKSKFIHSDLRKKDIEEYKAEVLM